MALPNKYLDTSSCVFNIQSCWAMHNVCFSERYFSVMWCKASNRKHKRWEGDAVLITKGRSVVLKDMEGKDIGRGEPVTFTFSFCQCFYPNQYTVTRYRVLVYGPWSKVELGAMLTGRAGPIGNCSARGGTRKGVGASTTLELLTCYFFFCQQL